MAVFLGARYLEAVLGNALRAETAQYRPYRTVLTCRIHRLKDKNYALLLLCKQLLLIFVYLGEVFGKLTDSLMSVFKFTLVGTVKILYRKSRKDQ